MERLSILQWLLPALFLAGAAVLVLKQRRRGSLQDNVAADGTRRALARMSLREFEALVGEYFRRREFAVNEAGRAGADGGLDLVLTKGGEYYLVRCKRERAGVGVETVRELLSVMAARHAVGGFLVTSGSFSSEAEKFAEGRDIGLITGQQLAAVITTQARRAASSVL